MVDIVWLLVVLPLGGALFLHFVGGRVGEPWAGYLATAAVAAAFLVAAAAAAPLLAGQGSSETIVLWEWIPPVGATFELRWDPLAALMGLVVTGIGSLVHLYAVGYMHGDERFSRFFTYLNLFIASMLILVLAGNYAMLFLGWELVGLCSYLLISFWYTRPTAAAAGTKAFVVNRIGDFGFLVGLMVIFATFGTLSFDGIFERAPELLTAGTATAIGLLLLVGAVGKSAQIPLHIWLPDAMEGPSPVSALMHAATMVTAGVYVIARSAPIFDLAPVAQGTVATIGAVTALLAASIAVAQTDIKRVLAYSTISQLGYMFLGLGVAGYAAGLFHLVTHAFFKALLFLGAGAVIHGLGGEQDMRRMGGLRKHMPLAAATMTVGGLALAGIPPFAGFWSKDEILAVAFAAGGWSTVLWLVGTMTSILTAFYIFRLLAQVFLGEPRGENPLDTRSPPAVMTLSMLVLALLAALGGLVNTPFFPALDRFLEPSFEQVTVAGPPEGAATFLLLAGTSVAAAALGVLAGYRVYRRPAEFWQRFESRFGRLWIMWQDAYRVDDAYHAALVDPGRRLAEAAAFRFDVGLIDRIVNGVGRLVLNLGATVRTLQTGFLRTYLAIMAIGTLIAVAWMVFVGGR